ncbi:antigen peptide transporter 2 [Dictyocaulus viviparus]|uniref:Antigen peptide transporter 2 n=1 Tax=Dictyocaulus viviparus TaxID=29172 RepID=A0A0D8Y1X2_DICVI|nr:antigen peptide transporter 2 [Dictyocaulus viviparus]
MDFLFSVLSMGFYSASWRFDFDLVFKYLVFVDGYDYFTNPIDFVFLAILRLTLITIALGFITFHHDYYAKKMFMPMLGVATCCYSYTLVKFLSFSEDIRILQYPGVWLSVVWSVLAALFFSLVWYFVITAHDFDYQRLVSERINAVLSDENQTATTTAESDTATEINVEGERRSLTLKRVSTYQHICALLKYCQQQWIWFTLGFIFLVLYAVARVFIPAYTGEVIANIVKKAGTELLVRSVLIMGMLTMISTFFGGLRGGCFDYATALVSRQIRLDLFRSLVNQDIAFFDVTKSGEMVSRLTSDCQTMSTTVSTNLNVFLRNGVMLIGALAFMFVKSWRLSLVGCLKCCLLACFVSFFIILFFFTKVTFIAIPLVGFITKWYGTYYDRLSEKTQTTIAQSNQIAEEVLSTMRTVRSFACERREVERFREKLEETLRMNKKKAIAYMGYTWNNEFCDNAILVAVLFYGGHLVMSDLMTTDQLITFLLYQMQLGENLYNIGYVLTGLMECVGASRKVFEYMHRKPQILNDGSLKPSMTGQIEFDNVDFTYPSRPNNPVLRGLNLVIEAKQTTALVGPSGGGKSSIVSLIQHFYEPNYGTIKIDGININDISHTFYHQKIALVAQEPVLYNGSVRYNILYGCDWATEDDMLRASKVANVHNFVMELENGYDTNCGEKGVQMSGGQKQRIAIARALVRDPVVLILDEATSALDSESEALVQEALNRCAQERTVLIIAHRLSTVEKADQIAVIHKGVLVQKGNHAELMMDKNNLYYSLVSKQILASKIKGKPVENHMDFEV